MSTGPDYVPVTTTNAARRHWAKRQSDRRTLCGWDAYTQQLVRQTITLLSPCRRCEKILRALDGRPS